MTMVLSRIAKRYDNPFKFIHDLWQDNGTTIQWHACQLHIRDQHSGMKGLAKIWYRIHKVPTIMK